MVDKEEKRVMDDFGNIIYIVAAIGWFFWNTYRKSQQAGKRTDKSVRVPDRETEPAKDSPFKSIEDMIRRQLEEHEQPKPEPMAVEKPSRESNQDKFLNLDLNHSHLADDYQMSSGESGSHRVKRQVERLKVEEIENEQTIMDNLMPDGFDLRKAVILNAILERPYV